MTTTPSASPTSASLPSVPALWVMRLLCVAALSISGYLAYAAFSQTEVIGCGGGEESLFSCDHVLSSKYSKLFGIPVSVPAFGLYASLLGVLFFFRKGVPERLINAGWKVLTFGSVSAAMAAVWFLGLQKFEIGHWCPYCIAAHSCGLLLMIVVLAHRRTSLPGTALLSGLSAAGLAVVIVAQVNSEEEEQFTVERFDDDGAAQVAVLDSGEFGAPIEFGAPDEFGAPVEFGAPTEFAAPEEFGAPLEFAAPDVSPADTVPAINDGSTIPAAIDGPVAPIADDDAVPPPVGDVTSRLEATDVPVLEVPVLDVPVPETDPANTIPTEPAVSQLDAENETAAEPSAKRQVAAAAYLFFSPRMGQAPTQLMKQLVLAGRLTADETKTDAGEDATASAADATASQPEAAASQPAEPPKRMVSVSGNRFSLNSRHWPLLGKPDAKYIFVEMFDYTCPHCRSTHKAIDGAFARYGDDLAVIALPVPLERSCNDAASGGGHFGACELARLSVAVWRVNREQFHTFHDWMFAAHRSTAQARTKAEELVGKDALAAELRQPHASNYISKHVELYKRVGRGAVPKLMFPKATMTGSIGNTRTLCNTIERELGK